VAGSKSHHDVRGEQVHAPRVAFLPRLHELGHDVGGQNRLVELHVIRGVGLPEKLIVELDSELVAVVVVRDTVT
jgi:hypothetical protein